eukprot:CAMPEP_0113829504 /NCGR_PEP_ID=MMETSP0328-20130328/5834_1 /TAXON_ID=39455 /ORGANISM="Alexandrium minutum" /LENGTH=100 /DNA_ID=CAMNT_0000797561 /DNA_START=33 /DNA_END=332 /DNA_ORIENTATION=- /assembly_acc=CAM_ASM_000350
MSYLLGTNWQQVGHLVCKQSEVVEDEQTKPRSHRIQIATGEWLMTVTVRPRSSPATPSTAGVLAQAQPVIILAVFAPRKQQIRKAPMPPITPLGPAAAAT